MTEKENKIRELENEIARLKSENELENRLEHIKNMAIKRDLSRAEELDNLTSEYADLKMQIDDLLPRMENLQIVRQCLKDNNLHVPYDKYEIQMYNNETWGMGFSHCENSLCTSDGYVDVKLYENEFGEMDCNVKTNFIYIRDNENNWSRKIRVMNNHLTAMRNFIINFDKFEKYFYAEIDGLDF